MYPARAHSYTARRAGVVMRQSAPLTKLELGSSLARMLRHDYGRRGPSTWGYAYWFLFTGGGWGMDVLARLALPAHCCSISPALAITPFSLYDLTTNSPLLKNFGCRTKERQQKKETDLSIPTASLVLTTTLLPLILKNLT